MIYVENCALYQDNATPLVVKDYEKCQKFAGLPQKGQVLAYKVRTYQVICLQTEAAYFTLRLGTCGEFFD